VLALCTVGGNDEYDPVSGVGRQPHRTAGGEHLVVGVRVKA
jgi:hypothetical protein